MRKLVPFIAALICFILLVPGTVSAATASASLTGPGTVRAGNTITLTFYLNGTNIKGCEGELSYDVSQVTLNSGGIAKKIASPWRLDYNYSNNKFVAYDDSSDLSSPINSRKAIFTATFKVNNSIATGTKITISMKGAATDGSTERGISASYSATIAAPLSSNANLSSLSVSNATISPSFSTNTTSYSATVPYTVTSLSISAKAEDSAAKVSISGNSLGMGRNTVSIKVTAASGATKTYTINVTRQQDPDYVASNDANLESITIDNGILSPEFETDKTEYIVYLPYEVLSFTVSGQPSDSKAQGVTSETKELSVGENVFIVTVTAEDNSTKEYKVTAMRMPELGSETAPEPEEPEVEEPEVEEPEITDPEDSEEENRGTNSVPRWLTIFLVLVGFGLGYILCFMLMIRGK